MLTLKNEFLSPGVFHSISLGESVARPGQSPEHLWVSLLVGIPVDLDQLLILSAVVSARVESIDFGELKHLRCVLAPSVRSPTNSSIAL